MFQRYRDRGTAPVRQAVSTGSLLASQLRGSRMLLAGVAGDAEAAAMVAAAQLGQKGDDQAGIQARGEVQIGSG